MQWMVIYPLDKINYHPFVASIGFDSTYLEDSDLSAGLPNRFWWDLSSG